MSEGNRRQRSGEQREGKIGLCSQSFRPENRSNINLPTDVSGVRKQSVLEPHQLPVEESETEKDRVTDRRECKTTTEELR